MYSAGAAVVMRAQNNLKNIARDNELNVWIKSMFYSMPDQGIQRLNSRKLLEKIVFTQPTRLSVSTMKWFGSVIGRLHNREGVPF